MVKKVNFITPQIYPELTYITLDSCISIIDVLLHTLHLQKMSVFLEVDVSMMIIGNGLFDQFFLK